MTTNLSSAITPARHALQHASVNVSFPERIGSVLGGAALIVYALVRRDAVGLLLGLGGGALLYRGGSGHCATYAHLGIDTHESEGATRAGVRGHKGIKVVRTVVVERPLAEVYAFWRNLENLPRFMKHVESVKMLDDKRSHWVVRAPAGETVEWYAEIIVEKENNTLSWQSLPGADVENAGSVHFDSAHGGAGTSVKVAIDYAPPAGKLGAAIAWLFGENPEQQLAEDLARFKREMEGVATV